MTPFSIIFYYAFAHLYEGRPVDQLFSRIRGDFVPLLATRTLIEYPSTALLKRNAISQKLSSDELRKKIVVNKSIGAGIWILALTFMYQNSIFS